MQCSTCGSKTRLHQALENWLALYEQAQADPRAVAPERLNAAFTELKKQAYASRDQRQPNLPGE